MNSILNNPHSYVAKIDNHNIVFCRPVQQRIFGSLLSLFFVAFMAWAIKEAYSTASNSDFGPSDFGLIVFGYMALFAPLILFLLITSAPYCLHFDLQERSYTKRQGYKPFARVSSGSLDEVDSLQISSKYSSGMMRRLYYINLVWKRHKSYPEWFCPVPFDILGITFDKQEAEMLLRQHADALDVRLVHTLGKTYGN